MSESTRTISFEEIRARGHRRWYRYGWRSPRVLFARFRNGHHTLFHPIFRLRMWKQRIAEGISDEDAWSLDYHLARVTVAGVKRLRRWSHGFPTGTTPEEWDDILARIETGFQEWLACEGWFTLDESEAKFKDAVTLLGEWFGALWD